VGPRSHLAPASPSDQTVDDTASRLHLRPLWTNGEAATPAWRILGTSHRPSATRAADEGEGARHPRRAGQDRCRRPGGKDCRFRRSNPTPAPLIRGRNWISTTFRESMSHPGVGAGALRSARAVAKGSGPVKPHHLRTSARNGLRVGRPFLANSMPSGGDRRCPIGRLTPSEGDHQHPLSRVVSASETGTILRLTIERANPATSHAARANGPANRRSAQTFSCQAEIGRNAISSLCSKVNSTGARPTSRILRTRLRWPT
jgi:hypothetical protein